LSTDEIKDFLLACSELGHRCSTEHCISSAKVASRIVSSYQVLPRITSLFACNTYQMIVASNVY